MRATMMPFGVRLNKHLASLGICSRREADVYIAAGWVLVDDVVVKELGTRIQPGQHVVVERDALAQRQQLITILFHKPIGIVSSQPEKGEIPARAYIDIDADLAVCGRLDKDSHGLLVLTSDGVVARRLIGPDSKIEKEYDVQYRGRFPTDSRLDFLRSGKLILDGRPIKPCRIDRLDNRTLRFVLTEGRNRQIRRMMKSIGCDVISLCRTRIGNALLGGLAPGQWRYLNPEEGFQRW